MDIAIHQVNVYKNINTMMKYCLAIIKKAMDFVIIFVCEEWDGTVFITGNGTDTLEGIEPDGTGVIDNFLEILISRF